MSSSRTASDKAAPPLGTAPTLTPAPDAGPGGAEAYTRADVPVSVDEGIHPGLATTAIGADEEEPPEDEPDPWVGRVLSNVYRVEKKIGEGGMGAVYLARHVHLQKPYAIKVLGAQIAKHAQAVERLKQEAIAASSIEHDNIVDVVNFDTYSDGAVYIVMELLRGRSLHARLEDGRLPVAEAVPIAFQICAALGAAHARGIVHRDLKPENVFLALRGDVERVKVLDFGISKVKSAEADGVRMTRTGQLVGTPLYMSPEQARGEQDIDLRVDIYALGVMLYEMLAGAPPFDGRNYFELLWKHGNEAATSLRQRVGPSIPEALDTVVMRALSKTRDERFQSMEAFALALEEAVPDVARISGGTSLPPGRASRPDGSASVRSTPATPTPNTPTPTTEPPPAPPTSPPGLYAAVAIVALLALGGGVWFMTRPPESPEIVGPAAPDPHTSGTAGSGDPVPPGPVEPPGPEAGGTEEGSDEGVPAPQIVTVAFDSTPSGAEVRRGDTVLCTTPCHADLLASEPAEVTFHRTGYLDVSRTIVPSESSTVSVPMTPRRRGGGGDDTVPLLKTKI